MPTASAETAPDHDSDAAAEPGAPERVGLAIVGAGFSGLAMAIRLREQGREDFVVLERGDDVGGTWRDNTYPGCRCDVPSHLYSLSFAPNPDWSESFSAQGEIQEYLRGCVERFDLAAKIRLGCEVTDAAWDDEAKRWRIGTDRGELEARVLISAIGGLVEPKTPPIPGLGEFPGKVFHSARWDHDHDLRGERVAVVGTGASSVQLIPQIQPEVERMHVFQRTPAWVTPRSDRRFTRLERALFRRVPALRRLLRGGIYWGRELLMIGLGGNRRVLRFLEGLAKAHLRRQVPDPELRRKLIPDYEIGCKRILVSSDFYPALGEDNVELIASGVAEVRGSTVVAADGSAAEVDTIIFGTGFHVTDTPATRVIRGADGRSLHEIWDGSPVVHRSTVVAGFPNLFILAGPGTGIGHTSLLVMVEAQLEYVLAALAAIDRERAAALDVRPEVQRAFSEDVDRRMEGTVWTSGGCQSWYLDSSGRNSTLWPDFTFRFRRLMERFDLGDFEVERLAGDDEPGPREPARVGAVA